MHNLVHKEQSSVRSLQIRLQVLLIPEYGIFIFWIRRVQLLLLAQSTAVTPHLLRVVLKFYRILYFVI